MKQFEKCWAKKVAGYDENNSAHRTNKATAKQFWEESLGWVKQSMFDNADCETLTFSDIEEELGG